MQPGALDYRSQYGNPYYNPYSNPLTLGQWLMIGAGALAVGGLGYWLYAKYKATSTTPATTTGTSATSANQNPYHWHQQHAA